VTAGLLRRLTRGRRARRVLERPGVERVVATLLRRVVVRESARFAVRELLRRPGLARYRVAGSGLAVFVRHGTADVPTLDEVFLRRDYDPPEEVAALLCALRSPLRVLDLGANIGLFGVFVLGLEPGARITAVEPDPANADLLRRCIAANRPDGGWTLTQAVAANHEGSLPFLAGRFSLSAVAGPDELEGATLTRAVDALPLLADSDLAKIDIEGGEWAILGDPRFGRCAPGALVVEYHSHRCPQPDPRAAAWELLEDAGYRIHEGARGAGGAGILWGWRPA